MQEQAPGGCHHRPGRCPAQHPKKSQGATALLSPPGAVFRPDLAFRAAGRLQQAFEPPARSSRAGLQSPVGRIHRIFRSAGGREGNYAKRVGWEPAP
jgi:hypothetical protein